MNMRLPAEDREATEDREYRKGGAVYRVCGKMSFGFVQLHARISTLCILQKDKDLVC